jgi:ABC-type phosphate transport system substrate-binding protein
MLTQTTAAFLLLLAMLQPVPVLAGDMVVIVSSNNAVGALRADQVADIFLGQNGHFPDGSEATPVDQAIGSPQRDEFYKKVAAKTPALVKAYWTKMVFTGRGQPPREVPDSVAVRKLVAENIGMIGYIDRDALDSTVKTVLLVR